MAYLGYLLLSTALIHTAQPLPAAHGGGRDLDLSVGGVRRQRRALLPYEEQMMSYPYTQGGGGANDLYYQSDDWKGRGLNQALQRLVDRDQRREQEEEQRAAYLAALLRLLNEAESVGLVGPEDMAVVEEEEDEEDQMPPGDFQGQVPADYDDTGRGMSMGRPQAAWWGLLEPQLAQTLVDRMEPQLVQTLLERARQEKVQQTGRGLNRDQDTLRRMVARILSSIGPNNAPVTSGRRARRDLSVTSIEPISSSHKRTRRSLEDLTPPSPSNDPPLLRVKRLEEEEEEEEEKLRPLTAGLQRMKRIDTMATAAEEELNHGIRRRRRRAAMNYDPQILIDQIVNYMRE
ncbi:proprotein convertase subtilisin/kexin type 1 inhibitor, like [Pleuronectes platessa]|uniref:proprotein convertase subtilisin/kexin type 1 inhibitor, like n=1 Tax=Pleuronectes platessa TaxID=8262 RepID=UPI00232A4183|nr:proprotein convertase subtilisin/kexin type 1 inhibitor, like [Pleuronectes platessa]